VGKQDPKILPSFFAITNTKIENPAMHRARTMSWLSRTAVKGRNTLQSSCRSYPRLSQEPNWRRIQKRRLRLYYSDVEDDSDDDEDERLDYRLLLMDSIVHKWEREDGDIQYCLAAKSFDIDALKRRKDLQLASLLVSPTKGEMHSASVLDQRKIGRIHKVCNRLTAAALNDIGSGATARSTLYGLSSWVLKGLENHEHPGAPYLVDLDAPEFLIAEAFATGFVEEAFSEYRFELWAQLARRFIELDLGGEPTLYRSNGGRLIEVRNLADMSTKGRQLAGAAFAIFDFPTFRKTPTEQAVNPRDNNTASDDSGNQSSQPPTHNQQP
jgi:hypothetical protein